MRSGSWRDVAGAQLAGVRRIGRRRLIQALPAAALLAAAPRARAAISDAGLVLACDLTLGPAMHAAASVYGNATGVFVNVFPTEPSLILPLLERAVQNDVVVTQVATLEAAVKLGIVANGAVRGAWRNRLVLAGKRGAASAPDRPIALSDQLAGSDIDGMGILAQLQLLPTQVLGVIDTNTVVAMVLAGTARAGLLHMTDVRAHPELEVIREVADDVQTPIAYAAAVTTLARRSDPAGLVTFLVSNQATTLLAALGLETPSS